MIRPITYDTCFTPESLVRLADALSLTGMQWELENLPPDYYARSGPYVIADWAKIWTESPEVKPDECPIQMNSKATFSAPPADTSQYILKFVKSWKDDPDTCRHSCERKAILTHGLPEYRKRERERKAADRKERRSNALDEARLLPERTLQTVRRSLYTDSRFKGDTVKFMSNMIRNVGNNNSAMIHMLFARFRGHKVAAICTLTPDRQIDALKAWERDRPSRRRLITALPFPTDNPRSDYDLYDVLSHELNLITGPDPS